MKAEAKWHKLLRIHKDDNVLIVVNPVQPGYKEDLSEGRKIVFTQCILIGHKVAPTDSLPTDSTWRDLQVWCAHRIS
jgi:hypothetical protein